MLMKGATAMTTQGIRYSRSYVSEPTLLSNTQGFLCVRPRQTRSRSTGRFSG